MAHHFKLRISVEIRVLKIRVKFVDKYFPLSPLCLFQTQIVKTLTLKLRARTPQLKSRYTSTQFQVHLNSNPFQSIPTNTKTSFTISLVK